MVNGRFIGRQDATQPRTVEFAEAGRYDITAFDNYGRYDRISVSVQLKGE